MKNATMKKKKGAFNLQTKGDTVFDVANIAILVILLLVLIYPLWFVLVASFSDPADVSVGRVILTPSNFTWYSYLNVFNSSKIWTGYYNTIFNTVIGTLFNLVLTIPAAYTLSKSRLPGRTFISFVFAFTMYFGGGLIPYYINLKDLNLLDNRWTLVVIGGVSVYNMIITRTYFQSSISEQLYEAAEIDGASNFKQFFSIALPLAKPIIAVMALYYAVGRWNEYYNAMIYLNDPQLATLQLVLKNILIGGQRLVDQLLMDPNSSIEDIAEATKRAYMAEGMKYAVIYVSALPMLIAYPFVQKYFVKGVMIGSVKG